MGPGDLSRALAALPHRADPRLVVGRETFDDAGVFVLSDDLALVQTVDFFAPIVDDPYTFGQIAAANALSDVYAMGGEPLTALNIVGFPTGKLPITVLTEVLRGGQDKVHEAGALIVGGHTIIDEELKYGLAVTGRADPRHLLTNAGAVAGDKLVLTKPIGTGILATAARQDRLSTAQLDTMLTTMAELNREASRAALRLGVRCATDVTGFGLLGHGLHIAQASVVTLRLHMGLLPVFEGVREAWRAGVRTGGAERNEQYLRDLVDWGASTDEDRAIVIDPQTSGGLLVAISGDRVSEYLSLVASAVEIGDVVEPSGRGVVLD